MGRILNMHEHLSLDLLFPIKKARCGSACLSPCTDKRGRDKWILGIHWLNDLGTK